MSRLRPSTLLYSAVLYSALFGSTRLGSLPFSSPLLSSPLSLTHWTHCYCDDSNRSRTVSLSDVVEMRYLFGEIAGERTSVDASDLRALLEVFCADGEETGIEAGM